MSNKKEELKRKQSTKKALIFLASIIVILGLLAFGFVKIFWDAQNQSFKPIKYLGYQHSDSNDVKVNASLRSDNDIANDVLGVTMLASATNDAHLLLEGLNSIVIFNYEVICNSQNNVEAVKDIKIEFTFVNTQTNATLFQETKVFDEITKDSSKTGAITIGDVIKTTVSNTTDYAAMTAALENLDFNQTQIRLIILDGWTKK